MQLTIVSGALETSAPPFLRSPSNQIAFAVRSDSVRRPIRFRSPSNRIPYAVQSDSVRRPTTIFSILKNTFGVSTPPTLATNSCSSQILLRT